MRMFIRAGRGPKDNMLHTDKFVFIHVEKTGGMSMTRFLINAVDDPVTVFVPERAHDHAREMATTPEAAAKLTVLTGARHEKPWKAIQTLKEHNLSRPPFAFSVIRHPVDMMLSYYKHVQKAPVLERRGLTPDTLRHAPKVAAENSFDDFCRKVLFYNMRDEQLLNFYRKAGFNRLDVVPLSRIGDYLTLRFSDHKNFDLAKLEHRNRSKDGRKSDDLDPATVQHIKDTYPQTVALYEAAAEAPDWA